MYGYCIYSGKDGIRQGESDVEGTMQTQDILADLIRYIDILIWHKWLEMILKFINEFFFIIHVELCIISHMLCPEIFQTQRTCLFSRHKLSHHVGIKYLSYTFIYLISISATCDIYLMHRLWLVVLLWYSSC